MIIPPRFYYEIQHPLYGNLVHVVIRYLPKHEAYAAQACKYQFFYSDVALLTNLYVHPDLRGQGLGKHMLKLVKKWQDDTKTCIVLRVSPYQRSPHFDLACLKNFYEHCGFREVKKNPNYHYRLHRERNYL